MSAAIIQPHPLPSLAEVVHTQNDELFDVLALLRGALATPLDGEEDDGSADRLVEQAMRRIKAIQLAFDPYI